MPNWKKVIVSGSEAALSSLNVTNSVTASIFSGSFTGSLAGTASWANNVISASYALTASFALNGGGGGGGGGAQTFTQTTPAVSWSFTHNLGTYTPIVQVYDSSYNTIQPATIVGTSLDITTITFATSTSGYAIISTGGSINISGSNATLIQSTPATTWSFYHGLNETYPVFTIFDNNDDVIVPLKIHADNANTASIYFTTARTGTAVAANCGLSGSTFESASWAATASFVTLAQTASFVTTAQTASYVQNAQTASYVLNAVSSSFASSAAVATLAQTALLAALATTASFALNAATSSVAVNANFATTASFAAIAGFAQTASFVTLAQTASYILNAVSASHAQRAISSSYALTASYAENITISGSITDVDYINFDTASSFINTAGRLGWDNGEGTLQLGLAGGNVQYSVGETLYAYAYNAEPTTLTKGQVVYISGSQGNRVAVKLASDAADPSSAGTLGLVAETITSGGTGWIITEGPLRKLNTLGLTAGKLVFLSSTPGGITQTPPTAPSHSVRLGYVERVSATVGSIFVKVDNGYEIGELHDVVDSTTSGSYGDLFVKSGSVWINSNQLTGSYGLTGSLSATSFTGSLLGTASYADLLDGLDSTSFVFTSSFNTFSSSYSIRVTNTEATASAYVTTSGSFSTRITTLETASGSFSTRVTNAESSITSLNSKTGSYATTGSNTFNGAQTVTTGYITLTQVSQSLNYADDAAAAAGGVPLGGLYRNGNFIAIRIV